MVRFNDVVSLIWYSKVIFWLNLQGLRDGSTWFYVVWSLLDTRAEEDKIDSHWPITTASNHYLNMSKFGVLVMGPAGAGKVCGTSVHRSELFLTDDLDNLLFRLDTAPEAEQTVVLLRQSRSCS